MKGLRPTKQFNIKRALLHMLPPIGALAIIGLLVAITGTASDTIQFLNGLINVAIVSILVSLGVSFLAQTGRRWMAWILGLAFLAVVGIAVSIGIASARKNPSPHGPPLVVEIDPSVRNTPEYPESTEPAENPKNQ